MKHRKIIGVMATVVLLTCLAVMPVSAAVPPLPCAFSGSVTLEGVACPGSTITVQLADGTPVVTMPAAVTVSAASSYAVVIAQDVVTELPAAGDTLNFYVDGYLGGSSTWAAGGLKTVNLATTNGVTYTLTTSVSPAGKGTVSPSSGTYVAGTSVTLTATAASASGYNFSYWSGTDNNAINPTTVTMTSNKSVTAYFTPVVVPGEYPSFTDWWDWWTG